MKVAITADIHLGKRQFSAVVNGRNVRELDGERAWEAAVGHIVEQQPDLVLIGGDVVEHPRVGIHAVMAWRNGVRRIVTETSAHLVVVQGNHDSARTGDVLSPIVIPDDYERVHIVLTPKRVRIHLERTGKTVSIACFPFVALDETPDYRLDPDPDADWNCVLLHAAAQSSAEGVDALPRFYAGDHALDIGREAERFDLIACGDYHEYHRLHPTALAFYPGSLERTTSNIWAEKDPKGLVFCDLDTGKMELAEVPNRPMSDYDFGKDFAGDTNAEGVNEALAILAAEGDPEGCADAIVRFKVDAFPKEERQHLDWGLVRKLKSTSTHFFLDLRFAKTEMADLGDRRENKGISLADEAIAFLKDDPEDVRDCVIKYLDLEAEVEDVEGVTEQ